MKKIVFVSCILFLGITLSGSYLKKSPEKFLKKQGFVQIPVDENGNVTKDGFFIFKTEVSNDYYSFFLKDIKEKGRLADYEIAKVDTSAWNKAFIDFTQFSNYYFQHEMYGQYPLVNISYEGAVLFCNWLTEEFTADGYSITVRLPDSIEWKTAARGGNQENIFSWEGTANVNKKGYYKCNAKKEEECNYVTAPVYSFEKNNFGLYNTCGNVAEMLLEKGTHKGGSWNSAIEYVKIDAKDEYAGISEPSPFIGFRPVAIINR